MSMREKVKKGGPPIIILIDILMQFMFVSMTQVLPGIQIKIPSDQLFPGAYVIYESPKETYFFDGDRFSPLKGGFYLKRACEGTICDEAKKALPSGVEPSIAIIGKLFENLSLLTFLACNTSAQQCGNIRYDILEDGTIDEVSLYRYNPIFKKIRGLETRKKHNI